MHPKSKNQDAQKMWSIATAMKHKEKQTPRIALSVRHCGHNWPKMARSGQKSRNWPRCPKLANMSQTDQYSQNWPRRLKLPKIDRHGQNWPKVAKIGQSGRNLPKWLELANTAQIGPKLAKESNVPMEQIQLLVICVGHTAWAAWRYAKDEVKRPEGLPAGSQGLEGP